MPHEGSHTHRYDDIIHLPHRVSSVHPPMPISDRAAQFAPFAALSGHSAAIKETARLTSQRIELDEDAKALLDETLQLLQGMLHLHPEITVTYFCPDTKKSGGSYITATGSLQKIDPQGRFLLLSNHQQIPLREILSLEGQLPFAGLTDNGPPDTNP